MINTILYSDILISDDAVCRFCILVTRICSLVAGSLYSHYDNDMLKLQTEGAVLMKLNLEQVPGCELDVTMRYSQMNEAVKRLVSC